MQTCRCYNVCKLIFVIYGYWLLLLFEVVAPQLAEKYPNTPMHLFINITAPPVIEMTPEGMCA